MIIKKFQANTETEAIMLAKEELGKDAIVMSIKTISPKGIYRMFRKPLVEITAAIDDSSSVNKGDKPKTIPGIPVNKPSPMIIYEETQREASDSGEEEDHLKSSAIERKLNNLQSLLEKQLNDPVEPGKQEGKAQGNSKNFACIQLIYNQLISNEVDEKYVNQIINEIESTYRKDAADRINITNRKDVPIDNILASVYQKIILKLGRPNTIRYEGKGPKFIFFVGPTGVGKTTTIAKIASKLIVEDKVRIAFIAADTYRIAAVDQLRTYANILGIPLKVVYSKEDMKQVEKELKDYDIVLVDTAGRSHRNREQRDDLENLINTIDKSIREVFLVLSATTKYQDLIKITELYSQILDYSIIFTKLDETGSIGNIFNIRMLTAAPLSYISFGQNVPDDIDVINAQSVAKQLLRGK